MRRCGYYSGRQLNCQVPLYDFCWKSGISPFCSKNSILLYERTTKLPLPRSTTILPISGNGALSRHRSPMFCPTLWAGEICFAPRRRGSNAFFLCEKHSCHCSLSIQENVSRPAAQANSRLCFILPCTMDDNDVSPSHREGIEPIQSCRAI